MAKKPREGGRREGERGRERGKGGGRGEGGERREGGKGGICGKWVGRSTHHLTCLRPRRLWFPTGRGRGSGRKSSAALARKNTHQIKLYL